MTSSDAVAPDATAEPKTIVITGGGRGIGAATARRLAADAVDAGTRIHLVINYTSDERSLRPWSTG